VKVVQVLTDLGVVEAHRGRGGGMRLAQPPAAINVGWLIRRTEPHWSLVECFDAATNTCPIVPACGLKGVLYRAQQAFLGVLDEYSLEQLLARRSDLVALLGDSRRGAKVEDAGGGGRRTPSQEVIDAGDRDLGIKPLAAGEGAQGQLGGHGAHPSDVAEPPGDQVVLDPGMLGQEDRHAGCARHPPRAEQRVRPRPEGSEEVRGEQGQGGQFEDRGGRQDPEGGRPDQGA
ncbi:MAG: Rrf2 family transcriptional regulator, partial [Isosphaeraceae bacterium]|nr:Rrf2 family transcriptional regulator [Isosphaeraceae bacterium]